MKKTAIGITLIVAVALLVGYYMYLQNNRYTIVGAGRFAYKIDKKTGKTWLIAGTREKPVMPKGK